MTWVDDVVSEFGRSMGFPRLQFDDKGVVSLKFERLGTVVLEKLDETVLIYMARELSPQDTEAARRALALCHYKEQPPFPLQAALHRDQELVFGLRIPARDFQLPTLERAVSYLDHVHQQAVKA
jgi:type III secretion system chaperone SycN